MLNYSDITQNTYIQSSQIYFCYRTLHVFCPSSGV